MKGGRKVQSMDEIYREHAQTVYRFLLLRTSNPDTAEELTQETFYQAVKGIDRFDGSCKVTTWLIAIAKNVLSSWQRKNRRTASLDTDIAVNESADQLLRKDEIQTEILKKIHLLSPDIREVMYMRLFGDLSFRQIGEIMNKSENWARVTYFRTREKLKKELENNE